MKREDLEHIIRAAADVTGEKVFVIIGSQAVLGQYPNAPKPLLVSREADIHPINAPELGVEIEGSLGQGSRFDRTHKYHADGIERGLPPLPEGWRKRLVAISNENTNGATGLCLEVHDIAAAKYGALREKDLRYTRDLWEHGMLDPDILDERIRTMRIEPREKRILVERAVHRQRTLHDTGKRPARAERGQTPTPDGYGTEKQAQAQSAADSRELEVRLYGEPVGALVQISTTLLGFEYDAGYRETSGAAPLSACLKTTARQPAPKRVTAWFEGLLPEGDRRAHLAQIVETAGIDTWSLLRAAGGECAGAVQIVRPSHRDQPKWLPLTEWDLARVLEATPVEPLATVSRRARISVAGAQDKVALHDEGDEQWSVPIGGAPSTHLLKPESRRYPGLVHNEHWCMNVASLAMVESARTGVARILGKPVLVVERYDRKRRPGGGVERIHQEDTLQALGRTQKYQEDGGPALGEIARIAGVEPWRLLHQVMFSWIIGNGDAHAKNYSVLEPGTEHARLSPAYDLVCTECYYPGARLAINIGKARYPKEVQAHHVHHAAKTLGIDAAEALKAVTELGGYVLFAIEQVEKAGIDAGPIDTDMVKRRAQWAANGLVGTMSTGRDPANGQRRKRRSGKKRSR